MKVLEQLVLAHRYRYYVLLDPVISDRDYDKLEMAAVDYLPDDSPVHDVGSSNMEDYPMEIRELSSLLKGGLLENGYISVNKYIKGTE